MYFDALFKLIYLEWIKQIILIPKKNINSKSNNPVSCLDSCALCFQILHQLRKFIWNGPCYISEWANVTFVFLTAAIKFRKILV
jgi:hypothetical protein